MTARFFGVMGLILLIFVAKGCGDSSFKEEPSHEPTEKNKTSASIEFKLVRPEKGVYNGAYIDFGENEDDVTLEAIDGFDHLTGKKQAIIGSSSFWKRDRFPTKNLTLISAYGAIPLIYWNPWDDEEWTQKKPNRFTLASILEGKHDQYIDRWADGAKAFGRPLLVAWGLEMNGDWFPWSGVYNGAGNPLPGASPIRYCGPETFKKTYRYIVDRVRNRKVTNIEWVFHVNNSSSPETALWNRMAMYYPGGAYVDWLAMSAYGQQFPGQEWISFDGAMKKYYKELAAIDPNKPILIAEWGVGHFPADGSQALFVAEALKKLIDPILFPRLKGAVYWSERWQNKNGSYSNLRINASDDTLEAFCKGIADPRWIGRPSFISE